MSEKYTPVSPEVMSVKMELLFPPQPLEIPAGISVKELTARALFSVPDVANSSGYEMHEAYIAALEQAGSAEVTRLEFSAIATGAELPKDISGLIANIDTIEPWRLATVAELMVFGLVYPALVDRAPLIALGGTAVTHYPLNLKRTGKRGLELQTDIAGIKRDGKAILLVRDTGLSDGALPTISNNLTADSFKSIKSHAEKIADFNDELTKFSAEEITTLASITDLTELLGEQGVYVRQLVGDVALDKIGNLINLARLKNTVSGVGLEFTPEQIVKLREILSTTAPDADAEVAVEIMSQPDFLNSDTMMLRERAIASNAVLSAILNDVTENTDIPEADLQTLVVKQKQFSLTIGRYNKLSVLH